MSTNFFTTNSLMLVLGMLHERLSTHVIMYSDNRENRLQKIGQLGIRAIFPIIELNGLTNQALLTHLGIDQ